MACGFTIDLTEKREARKSEALWLGLALVVHTGHECLEVGCFVFCDGWLVVVIVVVFKYLWEHVGNGLAFWVSHRIDSSVGTFSHQLVLQPVALAVASDDATDFPEAEFVKKLTTGDSDFAHEQLVDVVGGCQFFLPSSLFPAGEPSDAGFSSGSPLGTL